MNRYSGTIIALMVLSIGTGAWAQKVSTKIVPDFEKSSQEVLAGEEESRFRAQSLSSSREQIHFQQGSVAQGQLSGLLYKTPSFYPCGYLYTAELHPLSGDPDLYLHERVSGTWRKIKQSINSGNAVDSFTFTCNDITQSATNVDLDVKGYTAASYNFFLYREPTAGGGAKFMDFPLHNGHTAYTATINAVLDHSISSGPNCADYKVVAYTNEVGEDQHGLSSFSAPPSISCSNSDRLYGFKNASGSRFSLNGQYNQTDGIGSGKNEGGYYLFYDGHTGYDYPATNGTPVYPVAAGTAYSESTENNDVRVVHANGYTSYYLHLSSRNIYDGQPVTTNTNLGGVGQGHLHLTIKKGTQRVDPYGWGGPAGQDPLKVDGGDNVCLWKACP